MKRGNLHKVRLVLSEYYAMRTKRKKITIGIFGYGNMGRAIVTQLRTVPSLKTAVTVVIHSLGVRRVRGTRCVASANDLLAISDLVFLCVKPQNFYQLKPFSRRDSQHLTVISIMAGVRMANIRKVFPSAKVVRTMPNLPLRVGQGVIGWYLKKNSFSPAERAFLKKIFSAFGLSVALHNERMLDALTAVAGSGPAYVFLFANALTKAARRLGFSQREAEKIVVQTITGSLAYATSFGEYDFERLIRLVQSKGGTTEAALNTLCVANYYRQWQKAIARAHRRAQKISSYEIKRTQKKHS